MKEYGILLMVAGNILLFLSGAYKKPEGVMALFLIFFGGYLVGLERRHNRAKRESTPEGKSNAE